MAADPRALLGGASENLSAEERARRERSREGGAGIVGYATDAAVELASFALSGRLFTAELRAGTARELPAPGPVIDPRPSPDGRYVAFVSRGALRVVGAEGEDGHALATPESEGVTYGLAEFVAAEEMGRSRGFWWAPESDRLLVARVDDTPVRRWWISDPAHPEREPQRVPYPAAGTPNADVRLFVIGLDGTRTEVSWDRARYPLPGPCALVSGGCPAAAGPGARPARRADPGRGPGLRGDPDGARRRRSDLAGTFPRGALLEPFRAAGADRGRGGRATTRRR
ncbi:hypothetical protein GCM10023238_37920 [Streptomyces heliomycini]